MPSFKKRSYQKELLDRTDIPFADIKRNMQEIDFINRKLGGHGITLDGMAILIKGCKNFNQPLHIMEIGCGGGNNLRAIREWAHAIKLPVTLTGIDINAECIQFAKEQKSNAGMEFICSDYRQAQLLTPPDIIFSSLFCHH